MRIGIISEGGADTAVITNIIMGITGLDSNDIVPIRPRLKFDNTDLAHLDPESHSNWSLVMQECLERKKIEQFLALGDSKYVIIHLDAAEAHLYGVNPPPKDNHDYCSQLRIMIIAQVNDWLKNNFSESLLYAIAIQETEAWLLVIYKNEPSCFVNNPKAKLQYVLNREKENATSDYPNFLRLSQPLSRANKIKKGRYLEFNCSLRLFYEELKDKISYK